MVENITWTAVSTFEMQQKVLMKLGGKQEKEEKHHIRQSAEGTIRSPYTPTKRKRRTEQKCSQK